jgi:SpoVK/Ycf46/Vps4 family AAA+-type ATPase
LIQVLDFLLPYLAETKNKFGYLVVVFAGYKKHMETLLEHNPGLPERFPHLFEFEDYSDEVLLSILKDLMENKPKASGSSKDQTKKADQPAKTVAFSTQGRGGAAQMFNRYSSGYGIASPFAGSSSRRDQFGFMWTYDSSRYMWDDENGCQSPIGADNMGSEHNPLIDKMNVAWIYDSTRSVWRQRDQYGVQQKHRPGTTPAPALASAGTAVKTIAFHVRDEKFLRVAIRRLTRIRGTPAFGNARTVNNFFHLCCERQSQRLTQAAMRGNKAVNIFEFVQEDVLGPAPVANTFKTCKAYQKLQAMEGLREVKQQVEALLRLVLENFKREMNEEPVVDVMLNRVFLGNPGTGKTTVAKLYGEILRDFGLLSKGDVIVKCPSDFVGSVLGSSEKQTRDILTAALGCVLVIDEAYSLCSTNGSTGASNDPYKTAVIDTIVEQVQARAGDDRVVILLGYQKEMENMFRNVNPGLARRFQLDQAFTFADYDESALVRILRAKATEAGFKVDTGVAVQALVPLNKARAMPNFGNAGSIESLLSRAKQRYLERMSHSEVPLSVRNVLILEDFFSAAELAIHQQRGDPLRHFAQLIGCDDIKQAMQEYLNTIAFCKRQGVPFHDMLDMNFLFVGAPGTGKTTVARSMGKVLYELGVLPTDEVVEKSASDFTTGYVGQTGKSTNAIFQQVRLGGRTSWACVCVCVCVCVFVCGGGGVCVCVCVVVVVCGGVGILVSPRSHTYSYHNHRRVVRCSSLTKLISSIRRWAGPTCARLWTRSSSA